jgi:hypothetical protein
VRHCSFRSDACRYPQSTEPWRASAPALGRDRDAPCALRALVREVYGKRFGANGAAKIEAAIPESGRENLTRALRSRPAGSDSMSVVDYLYIAQLPPTASRLSSPSSSCPARPSR